ncbi:sulfotransferase [Gaiella sp.]|uniref:sulfotransferase family protein n=1 Tax=Gaiella sp. TaxID=2663207 RepID=UPI002E381166|nr:sulfotransferase [Gaiella sp.]HEX5583061.1 sulfotransferase [Gaiella sp.]
MRARRIGGAVLYARSAVRIARRGRRRGREERLVFVVGSPRSGTTITASLLGSLPGFVDLDEVQPWKAAIPELIDRPQDEAARRLRTILERVRTLALARGLRGVEQTPETAFVLAAALRAYPEACAVHVIRDGRDVATSLLERGWLSAARTGADDARLAYGSHPRFWVEPERREEFRDASDATRVAWAWRRYVTAAAAVPERTVGVRYEVLAADPEAAAGPVAEALGVAPDLLASRFAEVHDRSAGRWRRDLTADQLADVEREAGATLVGAGYELSTRPA